jgi:glutathione synthase/RimK-type ligase-like ATP-grasp enzyme
VTPGSWIAHANGETWQVGPSTTIWLRRLGSPDVEDLDGEEAQLARDELPHVLIGGLEGVAARWVDSAADISRAELKLFQLATADRLGLRTARSIVTNDPRAAAGLADEGAVIAKPLSPGQGIAPFVAEVTPQELELVAHLPVLLQRFVEDAIADLRVVVVGGSAWIWSRARDHEVVDWRAVDPSGVGFVRFEHPQVAKEAVDLTQALGLTVSVQDWLMTPDGTVFLEANPQGAWAFLDGSEGVVPEALALHLHPGSTHVADDGRWPQPLRRIGWDLGRASKAPANDGVEPPLVLPSLWAPLAARHPDALSVAQRANDEAKASSKAAEEKASRLTQTALAAVAVGTAMGGYQTGFAIEHGGWAVLTLLPVALAIGCLAIAAFEAVEIDRVGFYEHPSGEDLSQVGPGDPLAAVLEREERGRVLASWTSRKKHTSLMQARAWFSRGLVALLVAGLVTGATWGANLAGQDEGAGQRSTEHESSTTTTSTVAQSDPQGSTPPPSDPDSPPSSVGGSSGTAGP